MRNLLDIITGKAGPEERKRRAAPVVIHRVSRRKPWGRKVWKMVNRSGYETLTPWAAKEKRRRRAAGRVAKQARKANRRYRATGGLR